MNIILIVLFLVIAIEFFLSLLWVRFYFRFGIPIFYKKLMISEKFIFSNIIECCLNKGNSKDINNFTIKSLSANEIAVREESFVISRNATMHGVIKFYPNQRKIIAWGFLNWSLMVFFIALIAIGLDKIHAYIWMFIFIIIFFNGYQKIKLLNDLLEKIYRHNGLAE